MGAAGWTAPEFKAVYARHVHDVFDLLARRVGVDVAEELTAQTFLEAWTVRARYEPDRGTELSWLYGIAVNLLRKHHRQEDRRRRAFRAAAGREPRPDERAGELELVERIDAQRRWPEMADDIDRMTPQEREIFALYALQDMTYQGIADQLGIPVGTVRSRISRCRARMTGARSQRRVVEP